MLKPKQRQKRMTKTECVNEPLYFKVFEQLIICGFQIKAFYAISP
jgi:hypothetical protein